MGFLNLYPVKKIIFAGIVVPVSIAVAVVMINVAHPLVMQNEGAITTVLAPTKSGEIGEQESLGMNFGHDLAKQIEREGIVLAKNENDTLPLSKSIDRVNVFGHGSVGWRYGGDGSGKNNTESSYPRHNLVEALNEYGIEANNQLVTMYRNFYAAQPYFETNVFSGSGKITGGTPHAKDYYLLFEPDIEDETYYTSEILSYAESFSDTALVVLSRKGTESEDPPKEQYKFTKAQGNYNSIRASELITDPDRTYLEPSEEEERLIEYCASTYDNVIVVVNSTNVMELGLVESIPGVDACLIVGATGTRGADAIPEILYGDYSPSGRTADTYAYEMETNITYNLNETSHFTSYEGSSRGNMYPGANLKRNAGIDYSADVPFIDYKENIYVGYKWYETAYAEGYWDKAPYHGYDKVVQYPFGYGLSYTTFEWSLHENIKKADGSLITSGNEITNTDVLTVPVVVKNTGHVAGKDVVELYLTAPYTRGGIEKSYVTLVGFGKTPEIDPGESTLINIEVRVSDFESYDCYDRNNNNFAGYELEKGVYELKFMENAHTVKEFTSFGVTNGIIRFNVSQTIKVTQDEISGNEVNNKFTAGDTQESLADGSSIDGSDSGLDLEEFISRENFPDLEDCVKEDRAMAQILTSTNLYTANDVRNWDSATEDAFGFEVDQTPPTWGAGGDHRILNGTTLTDQGMRLAEDFDSEEWDEFLNQATVAEANSVVNTNGFNALTALNTFGIGASNLADGPTQIGSYTSSNPGTGYPCEPVIAQTWSPQIARSFGLSYGRDMENKNYGGTFGFGTNIHRSPFQGRNYEYFSECGFLSGKMLAGATKGLSDAGKNCFIKHLVLAETEYEREALYTFATEQALREIFLRPFKMAIQLGEASGIMTGYGRVGGTWAGGSEALLQGVIRNEFGFKGIIITDYSDHNNFMDQTQAVRAGSNIGMACTFTASGKSQNMSATSSGRLQNRLRQSLKEYIYARIRPLYNNTVYNERIENGEIEGEVKLPVSESLMSWVWWKPVFFSLEMLLGFGGIFLCAIALMPNLNMKVFDKKAEGKKEE